MYESGLLGFAGPIWMLVTTLVPTSQLGHAGTASTPVDPPPPPKWRKLRYNSSQEGVRARGRAPLDFAGPAWMLVTVPTPMNQPGHTHMVHTPKGGASPAIDDN